MGVSQRTASVHAEHYGAIGIIHQHYYICAMLYDLKLTSVYEYIELRLGPKTRMAAVLGFILNSLIQVSSMVLSLPWSCSVLWVSA